MNVQLQKIIRRFFVLLILATFLSLSLFYLPTTALADDEDPLESLDVPCLIVVDQSDPSVILYEKNPDQRCIPGSTMKIMTCILSIELCEDLDEEITATAQASLLKDSNSLMGVIKGETLTIRQLLYGLMLESGNDAALLLAQNLGGSTTDFVRLMNEKAASLGMSNTHFVNPSGAYKSDQYSTARDMAVLTCYAMKNATFREIVSTVHYTIEPNNVRKRALEMYNSNKLISDPSDSRLFYEYATGVKTGSTAQGGKCLVASASKDGAGVVAVLLGVLDGGSKVVRMTKVYEDAKSIMDLALTQQFVSVTPADLGLNQEIILPIAGDMTETISLTPVFLSDSIRIARSQADQVKANPDLVTVTTNEKKISLPVTEGDECAQAVYRLNGRDLFTAKLIATQTKQASVSSVEISTIPATPSQEGVHSDAKTKTVLPVWLLPILISVIVVVFAFAAFLLLRRSLLKKAEANIPKGIDKVDPAVTETAVNSSDDKEKSKKAGSPAIDMPKDTDNANQESKLDSPQGETGKT